MATTQATKIDLRRELKELYAPPRKPVWIEVPELLYLMIDGHGDPNSSEAYRQAVEALYAVAYALKFALKRSPDGIDYAVMPLEGLWWADDMAGFSPARKADWEWTMMIAQPGAVTTERFEQAVADVARKKKLPALERLRLETLTEGRSAQVLHVGPFSDEGPTIAGLHAFIDEHGYTLAQKHHEIYLRDPRRTAPDKMKTVIRQPVVPR